jgi:hypothetical protein
MEWIVILRGGGDPEVPLESLWEKAGDTSWRRERHVTDMRGQSIHVHGILIAISSKK